MSIQVTKTISAFTGNGISFDLSRRTDTNCEVYNLDILWADGESALDYAIQLNTDGARSLIEALQLAVADMETIKGEVNE